MARALGRVNGRRERGREGEAAFYLSTLNRAASPRSNLAGFESIDIRE